MQDIFVKLDLLDKIQAGPVFIFYQRLYPNFVINSSARA